MNGLVTTGIDGLNHLLRGGPRSKESDSYDSGAGAPLDPDLGGRSILGVDDDAATRELLFEVLTHYHASVR